MPVNVPQSSSTLPLVDLTLLRQKSSWSHVHSFWTLSLPYVVTPTQSCAHQALSVTRDSNSYFKGYFDNDPEVVVVEPGYFQTLNRLIKVTDRRVLANYVIGDYVMEWAHQLDERFGDIRYVCEISPKSYCGLYIKHRKMIF